MERIVLIMLFTVLRDMRWRRGRLAVALIATGLVFAITLVLIELGNGIRVETERIDDSRGIEVFMVMTGATGPFLGSALFSGQK